MSRETTPDPFAVIGRLRQSNDKLRQALMEYEGKKRVSFWRGVVIGGLMTGAAFVGGAAWGETITIGSIYVNGAQQQGTTVTISPSDKPGEWARVVMENRYVNQGRDDGTYALPFDGVALEAQFLWDADPVLGSDRVTILPPDGIVCIPEDCSVTVPEGFTGEIILIDWRGM